MSITVDENYLPHHILIQLFIVAAEYVIIYYSILYFFRIAHIWIDTANEISLSMAVVKYEFTVIIILSNHNYNLPLLK